MVSKLSELVPRRPAGVMPFILCQVVAITPAVAEPEAVVKLQSAPAECPSSEFVNRRFFELVGSDAPSRGSALVTLRKVEPERYDFVVEITAAQGGGVRRFSAKTCDLGAETAALIVALSLFPERAEDLERKARASAASEQSAPATQQAPPTATAPEPARSAQPKPSLRTARKREPSQSVSMPAVEFFGGLNAGVDATTLPRAAAGFGLNLGVEVRQALLVEFTAEAFVPQTLERAGGMSADFASQSVQAQLCYHFRGQWITAAPCFGAIGIRIAGQGHGTQRTHAETALVAGPSAGLAVRLRLARGLFARIYAESFAPIGDQRFLLDGTLIHEPGSIGVFAAAGPELWF